MMDAPRDRRDASALGQDRAAVIRVADGYIARGRALRRTVTLPAFWSRDGRTILLAHVKRRLLRVPGAGAVAAMRARARASSAR